ncbi:hypothetical protein EVA_16437, partial [gut metagenome]
LLSAQQYSRNNMVQTQASAAGTLAAYLFL